MALYHVKSSNQLIIMNLACRGMALCVSKSTHIRTLVTEQLIFWPWQMTLYGLSRNQCCFVFKTVCSLTNWNHLNAIKTQSHVTQTQCYHYKHHRLKLCNGGGETSLVWESSEALKKTVWGNRSCSVNLLAPHFLYIGQAFRYTPENAFHIFNQQIYFIIWYLLDRASLI